MARAEEFDLLGLVQTLMGYKYLIGGVTLVCAIAAVALALVSTPIYRAEVVITEVRENGMSNLGSLTNQLGGLASLAGVNLGTNSGESREAQAVLQSRHLIEQFIRKNNLLPQIMAEARKPPTLWAAVKRFQDSILIIREDTRRGTTTIVVEWKDPATAARWANGFVALADQTIRTRAVEDSKRNIEFLNRQIMQTNVVELQRVLYNLVETETKTLMLATGRAEYAFTVVDPAVSPETRARPRRAAMVLFGLVLGFVISSLIALTHHAVVRRRLRAAFRA